MHISANKVLVFIYFVIHEVKGLSNFCLDIKENFSEHLLLKECTYVWLFFWQTTVEVFCIQLFT